MKSSTEKFVMEYLESQLQDVIAKIEKQKDQTKKAHDVIGRLVAIESKITTDESELKDIDLILQSLDRRSLRF